MIFFVSLEATALVLPQGLPPCALSLTHTLGAHCLSMRLALRWESVNITEGK